MLECMESRSVALQNGVSVYPVTGNWKLNNLIQSKIVAAAFSIATEIELDLISQRAAEVPHRKKE